MRGELPVATDEAAWRALRAAHDGAGRSQIVGQRRVPYVGEAAPNNASSALIPAAFPRVLAQLRAASAANVDRVITFTAEAMYETAS